jgi:peptidoglycan/LPS O-acetylase OafA/YrhL
VAFFAMLMVTSLNGTKVTDKLFNHKGLFFIGKISYGIYVYHGLLRPFLRDYIYNGFLSQIPNGIISSIIYTIICTAISVLIAWVSWTVIESPALKLKRVFKY